MSKDRPRPGGRSRRRLTEEQSFFYRATKEAMKDPEVNKWLAKNTAELSDRAVQNFVHRQKQH